MNPPSARQMHKPGRRGIEDGAGADPIGSGGLLPVRSRPEPTRGAGCGKAVRRRHGTGRARERLLRGRSASEARRTPGRAGRGGRERCGGERTGRQQAREGSRRGRRCGCGGGQARGGTPVHRSPGRVRGHRAGGHVEGLLRVALFSRRRDQRGQRRHGHRRLIERGTVLGGQRRHLGHRRGDRQRRGGRFGELGRTLDRSVLRTVLPGCHAVIVDASPGPAADRVGPGPTRNPGWGTGSDRLRLARGFGCKHVGWPTKDEG